MFILVLETKRMVGEGDISCPKFRVKLTRAKTPIFNRYLFVAPRYFAEFDSFAGRLHHSG